MELFLLYFDGVFNLAVLVLGVVLIARAQDNRLRLWWGITMVMLGVVLVYGSIDWIYVYQSEKQVYSDDHYGLLRLVPMIKGFTVAVSISLFSVSSLSPFYLTKAKFVVFYIPVLLVAQIGFCYYFFNGYFTEIHSFKEIVSNIHQLDVQVRLFILSIVVIVLPAYSLFPILGDWSSAWRRATPLLYIFVGSMCFMLFYYLAYTLIENRFIFYTSSMANTIPCIIFSVYFLLSENPFSYRIAENDIREIQRENNPVDELYNRMQEYFEHHHPFVNPDYALCNLANEMHVPQILVVKAIKSGGFTGFREYINFLKIQRFKALAKVSPKLTVKELMYKSGFSSRSAFYRIFSEYENTTPTEFMSTFNAE